MVRNAIQLIRDYNNIGIKVANRRVNVEGDVEKGIRLNINLCNHFLRKKKEIKFFEPFQETIIRTIIDHIGGKGN